MCGSMVDTQSPTAEIRRGKKIKKKKETTGQKLAVLLRGSRPGVQSASLIMTSLMTS